MSKMAKLFAALRQAFSEPTPKQREAISRFFHTVSAAALGGSVVLAHSNSAASTWLVSRVVALFAVSLVLYVSGVVLVKEVNDAVDRSKS
jgi:hypothetical protein